MSRQGVPYHNYIAKYLYDSYVKVECPTSSNIINETLYVWIFVPLPRKKIGFGTQILCSYGITISTQYEVVR